MKSILFLLDNSFSNDKRVYLEAKSLVQNGYKVSLIAVRSKNLPDLEVIDGIEIYRVFNDDIYDIKKPFCFEKYAIRIIENYTFDFIHAHDEIMLHLGAIIKKRRPELKLIYDSHELFHEWPINLSDFNNKWIAAKSIVVRKLQIIREKKNAKSVDRFISVGNAIGKILEKYFKAKGKVTIIRNLPSFNSNYKKTNILREHFGISKETKIIVYMGKSIYRHTLNLEQVLEEFRFSEDVAIVFISENNARVQQFKDYVHAEEFSNVFFHPKVSQNELSKYLSSADVGLVPVWNKTDLSYWLALGNKLFDYIQAGIPILTTEQPEYKNIIEKYNCGICVNPDQDQAYFAGFKVLLDRYDVLQKNSLEAATKLCWENEEKKILNLYNQLL